jgi:beta-glucosidase
VVVLETGGPVLMPWLDKVPAVLEAWYPGGRGGEAIADVLTGKANPQGRLPVTFPAMASQLPNAEIPGSRLPRPDTIGNTQPEPFEAEYPEGSDVGYRWYAKQGKQPLFPFGFGLSYTSFSEELTAFDPATLTATIKVTNTGKRAGTDTPQLYITPPNAAPRLAGWAKATLPPGQSGRYAITIDPRFAAGFDPLVKQWVVQDDSYTVRLASSAADPGVSKTVEFAHQLLPVDWKPADPTGAVSVAPGAPEAAAPAAATPGRPGISRSHASGMVRRIRSAKLLRQISLWPSGPAEKLDEAIPSCTRAISSVSSALTSRLIRWLR